MSLEELEKELYRSDASRSNRPKKSKKVSAAQPAPQSVAEQWSAPEAAVAPRPSRLKTILWVSGFISFVVIAAAVYFIVSYVSEPRDVVLEVFGPDEVYRGAPFEITVQIQNGSDSILKNATLMLVGSGGLVSLGSIGQTALNDSIGDLGSGTLAKKTYKFLAVAPDASLEKIEAVMNYTLSGGSRFEARGSKSVKISGPAVQVEIKRPDKILSGSVFNLAISYKNVSDFDFSNVVLEAKYPSAFKFSSASLPPASLNNFWRLGELKAGRTGNLEIKGSLEGADETVFNLPIILSAEFLGEDYKIYEETVNLSLAPSPLRVQIFVNNRPDYIARLGDRLTYTIQYENLSGIALADAVINASLTGEMFDFSSLKTNGSIDSRTNKLTWNAANVPNLRLLDPGARGSVSFEINLKNQYPISRLSDKNFYLRVSVEMDSPSVPYYLTAAETKGLAELQTRVAGLTLIDAKAFYRDAAAGIVNAGLIPPKVNQPTQYTIHWLIRNYATDVRNVEVRSTLAPGTSWTGQVKSNIDTVPLYNERTGEVVWKIDRLAAAKGLLNEPAEAVFQIEFVPNVTQVGSYAPLLDATTLTAEDEFTGLPISSVDGALTTNLVDDRTVLPEQGRVAP